MSFVEALDATADVRDGRLWLSRLIGRGFGGPVSASGDLPLAWVEEYLPDGWRVDDAPAAPKPASFELRAEPDVKTLGAWLRPEEPGRMSGVLRLRMSGSAPAPSLTPSTEASLGSTRLLSGCLVHSARGRCASRTAPRWKTSRSPPCTTASVWEVA
jgi:hypothetical protein